jgi:hypothetical protein
MTTYVIPAKCLQTGTDTEINIGMFSDKIALKTVKGRKDILKLIFKTQSRCEYIIGTKDLADFVEYTLECQAKSSNDLKRFQ